MLPSPSLSHWAGEDEKGRKGAWEEGRAGGREGGPEVTRGGGSSPPPALGKTDGRTDGRQAAVAAARKVSGGGREAGGRALPPLPGAAGGGVRMDSRAPEHVQSARAPGALGLGLQAGGLSLPPSLGGAAAAAGAWCVDWGRGGGEQQGAPLPPPRLGWGQVQVGAALGPQPPPPSGALL